MTDYVQSVLMNCQENIRINNCQLNASECIPSTHRIVNMLFNLKIHSFNKNAVALCLCAVATCLDWKRVIAGDLHHDEQYASSVEHTPAHAFDIVIAADVIYGDHHR